MSESLQVGDLVLHVPSRDRGNRIKLGIVLKKRGERGAITVMWSNHYKQRCRPRNIQRVQKINKPIII
jgi:signal peptidase I